MIYLCVGWGSINNFITLRSTCSLCAFGRIIYCKAPTSHKLKGKKCVGDDEDSDQLF